MADNVTKRLTIQVGAADTSRGVLENVERRVDMLKRKFGTGGLFGQISGSLRGAGFVAGIGLGVKLLSDGVAKAAELTNQLQAGEITAGQFADQFVSAIPVIGNVHRAIVGVVDALSGATNEVKRFKENAEATAKAWAVIAQNRGPSDVVRGIREQAAMLGMSPEQRAAQEARNRNEAQLAKLDEEANADFKKRQAILNDPKVSMAAKDEADKEFALRSVQRKLARQEADRLLKQELKEVEEKFAKDRAEAAHAAITKALADSSADFDKNFEELQRRARDALVRKLELDTARFERGELIDRLIPRPDLPDIDTSPVRFGEAQDQRFTSGIGASRREQIQTEQANNIKALKDDQRKLRETFEREVVPPMRLFLAILLNPPKYQI